MNQSYKVSRIITHFFQFLQFFQKIPETTSTVFFIKLTTCKSGLYLSNGSSQNFFSGSLEAVNSLCTRQRCLKKIWIGQPSKLSCGSVTDPLVAYTRYGAIFCTQPNCPRSGSPTTKDADFYFLRKRIKKVKKKSSMRKYMSQNVTET